MKLVIMDLEIRMFDDSEYEEGLLEQDLFAKTPQGIIGLDMKLLFSDE